MPEEIEIKRQEKSEDPEDTINNILEAYARRHQLQFKKR